MGFCTSQDSGAAINKKGADNEDQNDDGNCSDLWSCRYHPSTCCCSGLRRHNKRRVHDQSRRSRCTQFVERCLDPSLQSQCGMEKRADPDLLGMVCEREYLSSTIHSGPISLPRRHQRGLQSIAHISKRKPSRICDVVESVMGEMCGIGLGIFNREFTVVSNEKREIMAKSFLKMALIALGTVALAAPAMAQNALEIPADIALPASVGYMGVTTGGAVAYLATADPIFAERFCSTALTALATDKTVGLQVRQTVGRQMKYQKSEILILGHNFRRAKSTFAIGGASVTKRGNLRRLVI